MIPMHDEPAQSGMRGVSMSQPSLFLVILIQGLCVVASWAAPVDFESQAATFLSAPDAEQAASYEITQLQFSDQEVDKVLKVFERQGFIAADPARNVAARQFDSKSGRQWLRFDCGTSGIGFYDQDVGEFSAADVVDAGKLKSLADAALSDLLGAKAQEFVLTHIENDYRAGKDIPQTLIGRTFRYMHKVDGRLVEGTFNHARITLGKGGRLHAVEIFNPVISRKQAIRGRAKHDWMKAELDRELQAEAKQSPVKVRHHAVKKAVKTLAPAADGRLAPSLLFTVVNQREDGKDETLEISMKEDVDQLQNLDPQDVELLLPSKK
jgi:hypothetical protein